MIRHLVVTINNKNYSEGGTGMLNELKKEAAYTYTENGAHTYSTTMNDCLDLFATIGGMRHAAESEIVNRFVRACAENPDRFER